MGLFTLVFPGGFWNVSAELGQTNVTKYRNGYFRLFTYVR
jgi:hypothetical protein